VSKKQSDKAKKQDGDKPKSRKKTENIVVPGSTTENDAPEMLKTTTR